MDIESSQRYPSVNAKQHPVWLLYLSLLHPTVAKIQPIVYCRDTKNMVFEDMVLGFAEMLKHGVWRHGVEMLKNMVFEDKHREIKILKFIGMYDYAYYIYCLLYCL